MKDKVLFITDAYKDLNIKKDTSILMIEEAINFGFNSFQCEINDLYIDEGIVYAASREILSAGSTQVEGISKQEIRLSDFKFSFMRKDPPVNESYINSLHLLGLAEKQGAVVFNKPRSIKEFNEKIFALHFKEFTPKTLVTSNINKIENFFELHKTIIIKPLDGMGGASIYKIDELNEENKVKIEMTLTSPNCPVAESLPNSVKENILKIEGINDVDLKLVWDPPWTKDKMSEAAKLELNL